MSFKTHAFTLIETLITIAVLTIIATISVPFLNDMSSAGSLNSAARELASDLRLAQQLSVTSQNNHQVIFDIYNNSYLLKDKETENIIKQNILKEPIILVSITTPDNQTVEFNATGAAISEGLITISNEKKEKIIEIKPSGYVKIQ
jgi:type IV fimbrial biogenesis protein FimT